MSAEWGDEAEIDAFLREAHEAGKQLPPDRPDTAEERAEHDEIMRWMMPLQLESMARMDDDPPPVPGSSDRTEGAEET